MGFPSQIEGGYDCGVVIWIWVGEWVGGMDCLPGRWEEREGGPGGGGGCTYNNEERERGVCSAALLWAGNLFAGGGNIH